MPRSILCLLTALLILPLAPVSMAQAAERRVALVIGNSAYAHTPKLPNPKNDSEDMAAALEKLGFRVILGRDLDKAGMDRKIIEFARELSGAQVGLFFYAGHGLQVDGQNYLVPVDAKLVDSWGLDFEMVKMDLVHRTMERASSTNLIFLDACRDNPLSRNLTRALGTRSAAVGKGLAAFESGEGTLISFSTQPGSVAADGTGRNSPYARALLKQLGTPKEDLSTLLIGVRNDVMQETARRQVPWEHSALTARFFFAPGARTPEQVPEADTQARGKAMAQKFLDRFNAGLADDSLFAANVRLARRGLMGKAEAIAELRKLPANYAKVSCAAEDGRVTTKPGSAAGAYKAGFTAVCEFTPASGAPVKERFSLEIEVANADGAELITGLWSPEKMVLWQPRAQ